MSKRNPHQMLFDKRVEENPLLYYYHIEDFPDMKCTLLSFENDRGDLLQGYFYEPNSKYTKIIIFTHGAGGGQSSYTKEIHELVIRGFAVFSFDATGTNQSKGDSLIGFTHLSIDTRKASNFIHQKMGDTFSYYLVGHSWGGYASFYAVCGLDFVSKAVCIASPISYKTLLKKTLKWPLKLYKGKFLKEERKISSEVDIDPILYGKEISKPVYMIHSIDDPVVLYKDNLGYLQKHIQNPNILFHTVTGHLHQPYYTNESANTLRYVLQELQKLYQKNKKEELDEFLKKIDWDSCTMQDQSFWNSVEDFLKG